MVRTRSVTAAAFVAAALAMSASAETQSPDSSHASEAQRVAKQLSNPVADLASIPFQYNWENGVGDNDDLRFVLNVQPVVPFSIGRNWILIGRFIMPFVSQPAGLVPGSRATSGTSDIVMSAFFSPKKPGLVWGVGPVLGLPTSTDPLLGAGKWSMGPTGVAVSQRGHWTRGCLVNHLWSIADTGALERNDVSQTLLQPFVCYGTNGAVTISLGTESTYNWKAESGQRWTVPINLAVSKVTRLGPYPFSVQAGVGRYVESPDAGPDWKLRTTFTLILPKGK